ncbi:uncharacterized protein BDZ99DRAFT_474242 [Mytilinidion resinicola]|uniref:Uncharacterized protein n=1 Tax=Mytilinidion resinicola TaxID=574789 RepID=A0A6A6YXV9_9PEZI|nr:uncharacterized protein BDZ99DRAFT_474242 [Mytilinidion resinicola]KAF2813610.1 hypothetical protein BDZ99DRAFT_474242 [Mytilinidion resinicola]
MSTSTTASEESDRNLAARDRKKELNKMGCQLQNSSTPRGKMLHLMMCTGYYSAKLAELPRQADVENYIVRWIEPKMNSIQLARFRSDCSFNGIVLNWVNTIVSEMERAPQDIDIILGEMLTFVMRFGGDGESCDDESYPYKTEFLYLYAKYHKYKITNIVPLEGAEPSRKVETVKREPSVRKEPPAKKQRVKRGQNP